MASHWSDLWKFITLCRPDRTLGFLWETLGEIGHRRVTCLMSFHSIRPAFWIVSRWSDWVMERFVYCVKAMTLLIILYIFCTTYEE